MVALNEKFHHRGALPRLQGTAYTSQFFGDRFIDRNARNGNDDPSLGSVLRQEPKSQLSAGVAHREINQDPLQHPGAVALTRLGCGTGFRLPSGSSVVSLTLLYTCWHCHTTAASIGSKTNRE